MEVMRQGDVLLVPTSEVPAGREVKTADGRVILAYGEVTGHAHAFAKEIAQLGTVVHTRTKNGREFLQVVEEAPLVHEEHDTVVVAPGCYEVRRQVEYSPEEIRNVAD